MLTAPKVYEAEADLLVSPISGEQNPAYVIAGLPQESADPTRDVETAARLATTLDVAERVQEDLDTDQTPQSLQTSVRAEPIAQSDLIAITASANTPEEAQEIANSFAEQAVAERTERMRDQIDERLPALEASLEAGNGGAVLEDQVTQLELLRAGDDPTIEVETLADLPTDPVSPRPALSVAGGLLAGLILGIAVAFASRSSRSASATRGTASAAVPASDPGTDPPGDLEAQRSPDQPEGPLAVEPRGLPRPARDPRRLAPQAVAAGSCW